MRSFLSEQELSDAAFYLLTSSSTSRYLFVARQAAESSQLKQLILSSPHLLPELVERARSLWSVLLKGQERDASEVELAIVITILAETAEPEVDGLLQYFSIVDRSSSVWIAALARKLLQQRPSNMDIYIESESWQAETTTVLDSEFEPSDIFTSQENLIDHRTTEAVARDIYIKAA